MSEPTMSLHAKRQSLALTFFCGVKSLLSDYPGSCQEKDFVQESVKSLTDIYACYEASPTVAEQETWWRVFEKNLRSFRQTVCALTVVVCLCFSLQARAQTSTSIVQDGRLVDITIPGGASLEQLKEIRLISKDVLTILEKQLDHEEAKSNHAETVDALFWYALLISPLVAFVWLLYQVKKLTVQTQQQQSLFIESRQALPLAQQQPLVMLSTSQALERRV